MPAAPFHHLTIQFTQPDGTLIELRGSGDEFQAVFETLEGYTVLFDPVLKAYCFAQIGEGGQLVTSGVEVQRGDSATLGLSTHLRVNPTVRQEQVRQRRQIWENGRDMGRRFAGAEQRALGAGQRRSGRRWWRA